MKTEEEIATMLNAKGKGAWLGPDDAPHQIQDALDKEGRCAVILRPSDKNPEGLSFVGIKALGNDRYDFSNIGGDGSHCDSLGVNGAYLKQRFLLPMGERGVAIVPFDKFRERAWEMLTNYNYVPIFKTSSTLGRTAAAADLIKDDGMVKDLTGYPGEVREAILSGRTDEITNLLIYRAPIHDLSPLTMCKNLRHIDIFRAPATDLSPLAKMPQLETIGLRETPVGDLSPLAGCKNLRGLYLDGGHDIRPLAGLTNLIELHLEDGQNCDLSPLAGLKKLEHLDLNGTTTLDLAPLAGLTNLECLDLSDNSVSDLAGLEGCKNLQWLDLEHSDVTDLTPLAGCKNLSYLCARATSVSDLSPLAGLKELTELNLENTLVLDLSPLAKLSKLESLDLTGCENVADISPLAGLKNLKELNLEDTKFEGMTIKDIRAMAKPEAAQTDLDDEVLDKQCGAAEKKPHGQAAKTLQAAQEAAMSKLFPKAKAKGKDAKQEKTQAKGQSLGR